MKKYIIEVLNRKLMLFLYLFLFIFIDKNVNAQYYQYPIFDSVVVIPENPEPEVDQTKFICYTKHFRSGCNLDNYSLNYVGSDLFKLHLYYSTDTNSMNCLRADTINNIPLYANTYELRVDLTTYSSVDTIVDTLITTFVVSEDGVGLQQEVKQNDFTVFPNPATDKLHFSLNDNSSNSIKLEIFDLTGQRVKIEDYTNHGDGEISNSIDISDLKKGVYFCKFSNGKRETIQKFVKN